ncbi:MAG: Hsp20/alpha crystallin family protein [Chlamydiae bacterium]|nr:MAG: Hsp20/alpha crystallin family protein [Chlamydiota bacterium]
MSNKNIQKKETAVPHSVERINDQPVFIPAVDIIEDNNFFKIISDIPGADKNSIDVKFEKNVLTIRAESLEDNYKGELVYGEYTTGNYERSFSVSDEIDSEKIEAKYDKGVLTLILPKAASIKPRTIEVKTE